MRLRTRIAMIVGTALVATSPLAAQAGFALGDLCATRAAVAGGNARFRETRTVAALKSPLERSGTLVYRRPDHLEMDVEAPRAEHLVIDGGRLTVDGARGRREIALADEPALLASTESLRATLAGDCASLQRFFTATLAGAAADWTLALVPRDPSLAALVTRVDIAGREAMVRQVTITDANGDVTRMDIEPMASSPR
jgi:outer membrane lipoprotein-sorting protein